MSVTESRIRAWRRRQNLTQQECADLAGLSVGHYAHIEQGSRAVPPLTKVKIARRLGARISDLFGPEPIDHADAQGSAEQVGE